MRARAPAPGFTLLELVVVMAIISAAMAIAGVRIGKGLYGDNGKGAARRAAALINAGRSRAVSERRVYYAYALGEVFTLASNGAALKELPMPEGARIEGGTVAMYPGGGSSGGELSVRDRAGRLFTIRVDRATGRAAVTEAEIEAGMQ